MAGVNAKIDLTINSTMEGVADLGSLTFESAITKTVKFIPGTALTTQSDLLWSDTRSLTTAQSETLDLSGGLTTVFGDSIVFAEIVAIYFENTGTTAMTIGNTGSNGWLGPFGNTTASVTVPAGEMFLMTNMGGWTVTAATADLLKIIEPLSGGSFFA
jgi:hypothetical protein